MFRKLFKKFFFRHLFAKYQWYRKWYGGRWEYHFIHVCGASMWLDMTRPRVWPKWVQPCSHGTPIIEDWPDT